MTTFTGDPKFLDEINDMVGEISEDEEIEILNLACAKGYISASDWNDGNYDVYELAERMGI